VQNEISRGSSEVSRPTFDFIHWRFESIKVIKAIGALQISAAREAISSKSGSGGVSRI
jgi:hypothetical protein